MRGQSLHCLWPQPVQVVLMTIMPPHLQQYSKAGMSTGGDGWACWVLKERW